ncbi:MAG: peptidoglycan editing factor PgeF [Clostridia bacterium]|jgi:YfiH family protein|nr:peptidoglycan editing factor PgeF [Clostridia bacterium]
MQKVWEDEKQVIVEQEGIQYLQFKRLLAYKELKHCYTLRSKEKLNFPPIYKDEKQYRQSCQRICKCLKIEENKIVKPHQTHTDRINIVNRVEQLEEVDGILTNTRDLALLTTSADCISLLFYDSVKKAIGSVHSGWRGTLAGICKNAVKKMIEEYKSNPKDIICCICPSIRKCHFEVDEDVKEMFYQKYKDLEEIEQIIQKTELKTGKQKYVIDTAKINRLLLKQMGLKEENIIDSGLCTVCQSDKFHSYRVNKEQSGRNAALICLSV